jgi:two-component system, OmpR family, KDP operon response regulator KdpE
MTTVAAEKKLILIVEDDVNILSFLRAGLVCTGYDVIAASNGDEALRLLESERPDLVVLDAVLSAADGLDILRKVRNVSSLPVIAAGREEATAEAAMTLGADEYIGKPFLPGDLRRKIKELLNDWPFPFCLEQPAF